MAGIFFYDCLFLYISAWFKYPTQVTLPVTKRFLNCSSAAGPVHRHSCSWASVALLWLPRHQLSDLLFCLRWSLLAGPCLWRLCPSFCSLLCSQGLAFSCSSASGPVGSRLVVGAEFLRTLNVSLADGASASLAEMTTCSPSCLSPDLHLFTLAMAVSSHAHLF